MCFRCIATLSTNPSIYIHPHPTNPETHLLSLLPSTPSNPTLAIGTSPTLDPEPSSFSENPSFLRLLHSVIRIHAASDPLVIAQARAYASSAGSTLGSGGSLFPQNHPAAHTHQASNKRQRRATATISGSANAGQKGQGDGAGGASAQGGMGGAGRGGYIHVSDSRNPPDWGRVAWPEDIFGSLEVDAEGNFVKEGSGPLGRYQEAGTYRVMTREGCLGLTPYLRDKVIERLKDEERLLKG
ncbi:hypothetical protein MMC25_005524 [Agyrium rufum]|nr:hypothetical protein [Agyrium rufum]